MKAGRRSFLGVAALLLAAACGPQPRREAGFPEAVPSFELNPRTYACPRAPSAIEIDGRIEEGEWGHAPWTDRFVDILGDARPEPGHTTRARMTWDQRFFYIAAELEEPHLWGTRRRRDALLHLENNFEVFLDADGTTHDYAELQVNALGTVFDLFLPRPYRDQATALHSWNIRGLRVAVQTDGTVNDPSDTDRGWRVELALPWRVLKELSCGACPPLAGDRWRVNFSRVEWALDVRDGQYVKRLDPATGAVVPADNQVWSPQRKIDMHEPELWGVVVFVERLEDPAPPPLIASELAGWGLRQVYYAQFEHRRRAGRFGAWAELGVERPASFPDDWQWPPGLVFSDHGFEASVRNPAGRVLRLTDSGRLLWEVKTLR